MITPLDSTVKTITNDTWPMIIICILTLSSIRLTYLIKNKKEFVLYREIFYLLFLAYILCLFQIVTFEDSVVYGDANNLVPFKEILRYKLWSRLFFKNVIGNIILFIPYGIFASMYTKIEKPFHGFVLVLFASIAIETTQLLIGRVFDIDDIILNVVGGMTGYLIYRMLDRIGGIIPNFLKKNWIMNIMSILLVMLFASYIWMVVVR